MANNGNKVAGIQNEAKMSEYLGNSSLFFGANETYLLQLYQRYLADPEAVPEDWARVFNDIDDKNIDRNGDSFFAEKGPSWQNKQTTIVGSGENNRGSLSDHLLHGVASGETLQETLSKFLKNGGTGAANEAQSRLDSIRAISLIRAYRNFGHTQATLDPLGLQHNTPHPELLPETYGFTERDYDRPIFINYMLGLENATLREILAICVKSYSRNLAIEYMHISDRTEKNWIQEKIEGGMAYMPLTNEGKKAVLTRLTEADFFETFLDKKYKGTKRFGLDGGEVLVPMLEQILKRGAQLGLEDVTIGMAHRGRLNVLANVMDKPYKVIFMEFKGGTITPNNIGAMGDVKYHLGSSADRAFDGKKVHLSLTPNPSHLEAVNTVVLGKVRARQMQLNDNERTKTMGILLHGDAAFIGQGIVAETMLLSQLDGYKTGGTIHIATNNQIGFTTPPRDSRSSLYCTDMAKTIDAPIIHVNGDDPEICIRAARIALEYRQTFKKDIIIDIICYRRHGHNESDEPMFTQPLMYKKIAGHPRTREIYANRLLNEGVVTQEDVDNINNTITEKLEAAMQEAENYQTNKADWLEGRWSGLTTAGGGKRRGETAVDSDLLMEVAEKICTIPQNFNINPKVQKQVESRLNNIKEGKNIDWGTAEALAFGSLLCEATSIRLSGEDCKRGTFSHRHAVWFDQMNEGEYVPLQNIRTGQADFEVINSPLSEFGVLGYEYGYACAEPHSLVLWEAQFGDFANGAQVIIDQFIASGETKWLRMCGLVMLLPHGYEGQGPEHSSARLERYLQLSADDNWQICNITTPANYFHALRRQIKRSFRKPLVIMSPKSLLRHPLCVSTLADFTDESCFHRMLMDDKSFANQLAKPKDIRKVIICSGKIFYDILDARDKQNITDIAIMRLEQLYPFPDDAITEELKKYPNAQIIWCQEESQNAGAWYFVDRRIEKILQNIKHRPHTAPFYVGRAESSSPATGSAKKHATEQADIIKEALS